MSDVRGCTHVLNSLLYQRLGPFLLVGRWQSLRSIDEDKKAICAVQGLNNIAKFKEISAQQPREESALLYRKGGV